MYKSLLVLMSGSAIAQAFTLLISPILSRQYTPAEFGVLGTVLATSSIFSVMAHGRFNLAIASGEVASKAAAIFKVGTIVSFSVSIFLGVCLYALATALDLEQYSLDIVISIVFITIFSAQIDLFNYWQAYCERYKVSARNAAVRSLVTGSLQLLFAGVSRAGLIAGVIAGAAVSVISSCVSSYKSNDLDLIKKSSGYSKKEILSEFKDYPLYSMPQGLIAAAGLNSAPLLLGVFFGVAVAGQYWLAYRVLLAPVGLLGGAYRQVIQPALANVNTTIEAKKRIVKAHTFRISVLTIPVVVLFVALGEDIFSFVFGDGWAEAGSFAGWLVLGFSMDVVKVPAVVFAQSNSLLKQLLAYEVVLGAARVTIMVCAGLYFNSLIAVALFGLMGMVSAFAMIGWVLTKS